MLGLLRCAQDLNLVEPSVDTVYTCVLNEHGCDYEPLTTSRADAGGEQNGQTTTTTSNDASNLAARRRQQRTLITAYDEARTPSTEGVPTT